MPWTSPWCHLDNNSQQWSYYKASKSGCRPRTSPGLVNISQLSNLTWTITTFTIRKPSEYILKQDINQWFNYGYCRYWNARKILSKLNYPKVTNNCTRLLPKSWSFFICRRISLAYSCISLADVAKKLRLDSPMDAEYIIAKVKFI